MIRIRRFFCCNLGTTSAKGTPFFNEERTGKFKRSGPAAPFDRFVRSTRPEASPTRAESTKPPASLAPANDEATTSASATPDDLTAEQARRATYPAFAAQRLNMKKARTFNHLNALQRALRPY